MASPYTKGATNAATIGDVFDLGDILVTSVAWAAAASSTATITHGLTGTPDWVQGYSTAGDLLTATINSTTVVFVRSTTGAGSVHAIIGDKT